MTPAKLLEAIKEAPGPSAELDKSIAELMGIWPFKVVADYITPINYSVSLNSNYQPYSEKLYYDRFPNFTGSIDATVAAIKARWPECDINMWAFHSGYNSVELLLPALRSVECEAATPELALCAAFVAALMEDGE